MLLEVRKLCDRNEHVQGFSRLMSLNVLYIVAVLSEPRYIFHGCSQKLFFKGELTRSSESQGNPHPQLVRVLP